MTTTNNFFQRVSTLQIHSGAINVINSYSENVVTASEDELKVTSVLGNLSTKFIGHQSEVKCVKIFKKKSVKYYYFHIVINTK